MRNAICEVCKQIKSVEEIKYVNRGAATIYVCNKCRGAQTNNPERIVKKSVVTVQKVPYQCHRCNYPFRQNPELKVVCPACGKGDKAKPTQ